MVRWCDSSDGDNSDGDSNGKVMLYYSSDGDSGDGDNSDGDSSDGDVSIVWLEQWYSDSHPLQVSCTMFIAEWVVMNESLTVSATVVIRW